MADRSHIEWTEATWNPVSGCTKVSAGCAHCYAERMARRLQAAGSAKYRDGFAVRLHRDTLGLPLRWREPRLVFVNSMGDLFHEDVPEEFVRDVFDVMRRAHWHVFQVLTKRSARLLAIGSRLDWPANVWAGVTVENHDVLTRVDDLRRLECATVRFLSLEPLLGPLDGLDLSGIDWVIVGGESGPQARPMRAEWVRAVRDLCHCEGVPFYFKQWGGRQRKRAGRLLDGRVWDEMPRPRLAVSPGPGFDDQAGLAAQQDELPLPALLASG